MNQGRPIRVMQVIARMNVGGPAVIVAELMRGLNTTTFQQQLVTGYCAEDEADYLDQVATDIKAIRILGLGRSVSLAGDLKSFFGLMKQIRDFKPDVIHTHTAKAGVLGRLAGLLAYPKARRVHTFHGHLLHGYFGRWRVRVVIVVESLLALISTSLIAIGNQVKDDLLKAGIGSKAQYVVIFPGLADLKTQGKESARIELALDAKKVYLVFIARLTQVKRPDRLLDIARFLKMNYSGAEILVVGEGEKFEATRSIATAEHLPLSFLGWRNDIGRILSASDIAILCSDNEGIPLTLIQAAQAGLPIVSTNVGSIRDIVEDGQTGLLTDVNSHALIVALGALLNDPNKVKTYGEAGKIRAERFFSLGAMINSHERLYSHVTCIKN